MEIWTLATQKGGAGKTTLAANLAVAASAAGENVLLIDLDPQASASKWWERREVEAPALVKLKPEELAEGLAMARAQSYSLVLIDTAGKESIEHNEAIIAASFCLIPCQPSVLDIEAVSPTVEQVKRIGKNFAFVLTRCPSSGNDQQSTREGLSGHGLVAKASMGERKDFKHSFGVGEGVTEYAPKGKAALEVTALFDWVKSKSRRLTAA